MKAQHPCSYLDKNDDCDHFFLHKPHVTEVLPSLTSISLCKRVDLGRPPDTRFIESAGIIIGPTYGGHSYSLCMGLNSGAQVLKYDCII